MPVVLPASVSVTVYCTSVLVSEVVVSVRVLPETEACTMPETSPSTVTAAVTVPSAPEMVAVPLLPFSTVSVVGVTANSVF